MTSSKSKKNDQHTHDMAQIEGGHVDDRVGVVPGPAASFFSGYAYGKLSFRSIFN